MSDEIKMALAIASGLFKVGQAIVEAAQKGKTYTPAQIDSMMSQYTNARLANIAAAQSVLDAASKVPDGPTVVNILNLVGDPER